MIAAVNFQLLHFFRYMRFNFNDCELRTRELVYCQQIYVDSSLGESVSVSVYENNNEISW